MQEEVWNIIEGEVEFTIAGVAHRAGPGFAGIVPPNTLHSLKAITSGKAMVVDYPLREGFIGNVQK